MMVDVPGTPFSDELVRENERLRTEIAELKLRLEEAESSIEAIRSGEVDAIVVDRKLQDPEVFALASAHDYYLQLAHEAAHVGAWSWNLETNRVSLSAGSQALLQLPQAVCDGHLIAHRLHPDDSDRILGLFTSEVHREGFAEEFRILLPEGECRWLAIRGQILRDAPHGPSQMVGVINDITDRKQTEQELRRRERKFRELADAMPQIVWSADAKGIVDYYNRRWYEFTAMPESVTGDESFLPVLHPDDRQHCFDVWYNSVKTGLPYEIEYRLLDGTTGKFRWHLGRALPVLGDQQRVERWFGTCTDIHNERMLREALREADQRKDAFLATLAHELRNPLSPLKTAVELIGLQRDLSPQLRDLCGVMTRQIEQLVRLIDDLLDISRIASGKLNLRREPMNLLDAIHAALDISRPLIQASSHTLNVNLPVHPIPVLGDRVRLTEVVGNLLVNAAKYTPPGGEIQLTVQTDPEFVVLSLRDNGIGIPTPMLPRIFGLFMQVDSTATRAQGGLGIGLTLAKTFVEMHEGTIEALSEGPGQGSEFRVRIPLTGEAPNRKEHLPEDPHPIPAYRILVVDDNRSASQLLSRLLQALGQTVRIENNVLDALQAVSEFHPDILVSDIAMPGYSGYDLARRVRSQTSGSHPILVAVTGYGQDSDRKLAVEAGFDHHFTKPIGLPGLKSFLKSLNPKQPAD